jgi:hypothetical protein
MRIQDYLIIAAEGFGSVADWCLVTVSAVGAIATIIFSYRAERAQRAADQHKRDAEAILTRVEESSKRAAVAEENAAESANRANDLASGQAENELRRDISTARHRYEDVAALLEGLRAGRQPNEITDVKELAQFKALARRTRSAAEDYVNQYENACAKYIDNKIDKERFKRTYFSEIRTLCEVKANENSILFDLLNPEATSKFQAIWRVYREWYYLEKKI